MNVIDASSEGAMESDHLLSHALPQERLRDCVHLINQSEVHWAQSVAILNVTLGYYQVVLFGLGTNVWEGDKVLVFIDYQGLISLARLDDLTEFANLRHSPVLVMRAQRVKLVLASRFE